MANRSHVTIARAHLDAKFYCGDKVRMRDPDTGNFSCILWVARVQWDEASGGWKFDINSQNQVLVHIGVEEKDLKDA